MPPGSADEALVRRLEQAAANVNAAAADTAIIERLQDDLRELAAHVLTLGQRQPTDWAPDLSGVVQRLGALEQAFGGMLARLDDLYAWHDRLSGQVNTMASYRPDRRMQPPADIPPPPPSGEMQHSWVQGLADIREDDPLPEGPDGHGNEPASDHAQQVNAVREPIATAEPARQHLTIEETRRLEVEDRWAKPFARYQIAQQAMNGSVPNRRLLQGPAERRGISIDALAQQILAEWKDIEQQIMADY
jgi:hypothetical protein